MNVGYPDLRFSLLKRGWIEVLDKNNDDVNLKFSFTHTNIDYHRLPKTAMVNHCWGEASMTCKTGLIETLTENFPYWASWLADESTGEAKINIKDYSIGGVDSFFPKCFIISNMQD